MDGARDRADALEIVKDAALAVDVVLENSPVIDSTFSRSAGIGKNKPAVEFLRRHRNCLAMNAINIQMDGIHSTVERGIVILTSGGNTNELGFRVLCQ